MKCVDWDDAKLRAEHGIGFEDMRHYVDEATGDLLEVIPEQVLSLPVFFGSIVAWVTNHLPQGDWLTNVPCRRSPGRRRCRGEIVAELDLRRDTSCGAARSAATTD